MPRDGSGVYSAPAGTTAVPDTPVASAPYNAYVADQVADANAARPVTAGGTGANTAAGARTNLGALQSTASMVAFAGLSIVADKLPYGSGTNSFALLDFPEFGRTLVANASAEDARTDLGLGTMSTQAASAVAITGGTSAARILDSGETTGALTSASANRRVVCSGNVTLPALGMTAGDAILIDPSGTARTITRPGDHTMYIDDVDSATGTTNAHNVVVAIFHGSAKWTLQGAVG